VSRSPARSTIREVARRANVSLATVSRVLNGTAPVSTRRERDVRRAVRDLAFRPNLTGRNLRASRTHTIGAVLPTLMHPVFAECLHAIEAAARGAGFGLSIGTTGYDAAAESGVVEQLLRQRVDGLVLTVADAARNRMLDQLDREGVPYVLLFNQLARSRRTTVSVDNRAAARDVVAHLLALGHREIRMVAGRVSQSDRTRLRARGFVDALAGAGIEARAPLEVPFMQTDVRASLLDLVNARPRPTALFCSSDHLALGVLRDLAAIGRRVPAALSVVGFDGTAQSALAVPALTTVVQPIAAIGATALERLVAVIAGDAARGPVLLPHTLRAGGTTAAPARGATSLLRGGELHGSSTSPQSR
jgi:DNA-binding LacI/PurR family transcriptional regulator